MAPKSTRAALVSLLIVMPAVIPAFARGDDETKRESTDRFGDPLLAEAVARTGTTRLRHGHARLKFAADGKTLVSWGYDRAVRTWDVATGKSSTRRLPARWLSFPTAARWRRGWWTVPFWCGSVRYPRRIDRSASGMLKSEPFAVGGLGE